ncbi:chaperone modulator CbpM [Herminiimonas fonticola]|uniref:Chaperone modulatory protein CbpM n=1 Tax=Herminiimonas fonticola TaxID=303380 RepID=A0A4R6G8Y1_9BURK|nr:chaperone modulator CbpM [Herminiimonas fonticola]RBA24284.1 MerR HTH family regulatory protein [Herminiimonas fonticola]TDN90285.1 chaperone modulatory protein CbpM [Herminiimonas fonticola]
MSKTVSNYLDCQIVEEDIKLTLFELCQASHASEETIRSLVMEGVLEPIEQQAQEWQFPGSSLRRAKLAQQLTEDMEINPSGVALVLDLLDRIASLQAQLVRLSRH